MDDAAVGEIRSRARALLEKAVAKGYAELPVKRHPIISWIANKFLTGQNICAALTRSSGATEATADELRNDYKTSRLQPAKAQGLGLVSGRIPLTKSCPEGYDWANSEVYEDVESCEEVTDEFDPRGMPVAMYAAAMDAKSAQAAIDALDSAGYFSDNASGAPFTCGSGKGYSDTFQSYNVLCSSVDFVMRIFPRQGWSAWTMRRSCVHEGVELRPDDLMYTFGMRVFVPIEVSTDGKGAEHTIMISSVATAANTGLTIFVPADLPGERFLGSEYAKKIFLEAKAKGWKIRQ